MSGQTLSSLAVRRRGPRPFNGGPDNCPARPGQGFVLVVKQRRPSMEGRTIVRPDLSPGLPSRCHTHLLQWRAGQLSGQTRRPVHCQHPPDLPSMEGRTIVRPDVVFAVGLRKVRIPSMEGRTIVRPDRAVRKRWCAAGHLPSMEGRTIVRPDLRDPPRAAPAGPDLQWRAGQLSGQTAHVFWGGLPACSRAFASGVGSRSFEGN